MPVQNFSCIFIEIPVTMPILIDKENIIPLLLNKRILHRAVSDKGKPRATWRRKATGHTLVAGLPKSRDWFLYFSADKNPSSAFEDGFFCLSWPFWGKHRPGQQLFHNGAGQDDRSLLKKERHYEEG